MATIGDVARMAGVSKTTVSRYLNNNAQGHMAAETESRIREAIEALDYNPSAVAQSLKKKSTNMIGLVVHDMTNPFLQQMIRGVEAALQDTGVNLMLCSSHMDVELEAQCIRMLNQRQVDGILLVGLNYPSGHLDRAGSNVPIVLLEREAGGADYDMLRIDNLTGAYEAVKHLIERGHKKIAHVKGAAMAEPAEERCEAYRRCLRDHGIPVREEWIVQGDYKPESGYRAMEHLMQIEDRPTAVFLANDGMAMGAMRCAMDRGITIPEDVALVGFDDIDTADLVELTTVRQPVYQLAQLATQTLLRRIKTGTSPDYPPQSVVLNTQLIIRWSS